MYSDANLVFFFFFQAEDGIRDDLVTGVQTCALPIAVRCLGAWTRRGGGGVRDFLAKSAAIVAASARLLSVRKGAYAPRESHKEGSMSWLDKLLGRGKKATGDM